MSQRINDWKTGVVTTASNVAVGIVTSDTIPDGSTAEVEMSLVGRNTATGEGARCRATTTVKRVGGVLSAVGSLVELVTFAAASEGTLVGCVPSFAVVGNTIQGRVAGILATNIEWFGNMWIRIN